MRCCHVPYSWGYVDDSPPQHASRFHVLAAELALRVSLLLPHRVDDTLMNLGRAGLGVTLLVSFPLLVVPLIGTLVRAHKEMSGKLEGMREPSFVSCTHMDSACIFAREIFFRFFVCVQSEHMFLCEDIE